MPRESEPLPTESDSTHMPVLVVPRHVSKKRFIYDSILNQIQGNTLAVGTRLPSATALAAEWQVAYATIHAALNDLTREGWLERNPKLGTFVSRPRKKTVDTAPRTAAVILPPREDIVRSGNGDSVFEMLQGLIEGGRDVGWNVRVESIPSASSEKDEEAVIESVSSASVVIFVGIQYRRIVEHLAKKGVPTMTLAFDPGVGHAIVYDRAAGVRKAVAYLASKGRKRIAFMGNLTETGQNSKIEPFLKALEEQGLDWDPSLGFHLGSHEEIPQVMNCFVKTKPPCDSIFVTNYRIASALMKDIRAHGIRIPQELAVVALGIAVPTIGGFSPTFIRVPFFEFGDRAIRWIASKEEILVDLPREVLMLESELVISDPA